MATINVNEDFSAPIEVLGADDILNVQKDVIGDVLGTVIEAGNVADGRQFNIRGILVARNSGDAIRLGLDSDPYGSSGGRIEILGSASLRSDAGSAIAAFIEDIDIINAGKLRGAHGITGDMLDGFVLNKGSIVTAGHCFQSAGEGMEIINRGLLKSTDEAAVLLTGGGNSFLNSGVIRGPDIGPAIDIGSEIADFNTLTITGQIFSDDVAIQCGAGSEQIFRDGFISGDIILGDGFNQFSCRRGTLEGSVFGGMDNDVYDIFSRKIKIVEQSGGGTDSVFAGRSVTLGDFIENLTLLGRKDIAGNGNAEDNDLFGNRGDNLLRGFGGMDFFSAGRGGDILSGGADADWFQFFSDSGKDKILDFTLGEDKADLTSFGFSQFSQIRNRLHDIDGGTQFRDGKCAVTFRGLNGDDFVETDFFF